MKIKNCVPCSQNFAPGAVWWKTGLVLLAVFLAVAGKAQTNFASAEVISGVWGSVTYNNTGVTPPVGTPNIAGYAPHAPIWFQWTAPQDGVVTLDTLGSLDGNSIPGFLNLPLDTVLAVFTGTNPAALNQIAANDDLYPINGSSSTRANSQSAATTQLTVTTSGDYGGGEFIYASPFYGPSALRFNAKGGQTYYFAVDSKVVNDPYSILLSFGLGTGTIQLNWAYKPSGVFRFASENMDPFTDSLLYETAETESQPPAGLSSDQNSVVLTYYDYNAPGLLVTVTRAAGSTGRAMVNYTTVDGTALSLVPPFDEPASAGLMLVTNVTTNYFPSDCATNIVITTNVTATGGDYVPVSGTLVFDDYEMSKTILIPINYRPRAGDQANRVFGIQLIDDGGATSPVLDPNENSDVSAPRVDPVFGTAEIRILNSDADPYGPDMVQNVTSYFSLTPTNGSCITNFTYVTNYVEAQFPTNPVFNFEKANYRVPADVNDPNVSPWTQVTLYVERFGTNGASQGLNYRVNNYLGSDADASEEENIFFPLQPGSDYAVPTPPNWLPIRGTNSDFTLAAGTISFPAEPAAGATVQPLRFTIPTSTLTKFNKDFKVTLNKVDNNTVYVVGMVNEATVTILFNDQNPPAGSVDEFYNADFNSEMATYPSLVPMTTPPNDANPGVGLFGEVYGLTILTNNEAFIGGDFQSYNGLSQNHISQACVALVNTNGQLDTSFYPGSGANGAVNAVVADGSQFVIGGAFSSYNGTLASRFARLNADGSIDNSFSSHGGADNTVRAMLVLTNGEVLIAGDFTHVNGAPANYVALLNTDGTLDTSFNPGNNLNGPVYALVQYTNNATGTQQIVVGGNFAVAGQIYQNIARLNLDGSVDAAFNPGTGADNVVHALGAQVEGQILVGGEFTHFNGLPYNRIARLNTDGSLDLTNFFIGTGADSTVFCVNPTTVTNLGTDPVTGNTTTNYATAGIYLGGAFASVNGTHRLGFARLYPNGTVDTTFMDTAYNQFAGLKRIFSYDAPAVFTTAIQNDGNILIGGSFNQVGGGQANTNVCNTLDDEMFIDESFGDTNLWVEPKTRDGVRNRSGLARLIGGATPGPGNVGFNQSGYSGNKSQSSLSVSLIRTNGVLGPVGANFAVQPGLAHSGSDYTYDSTPPLFWVDSQFLTHPSRVRSDGLFGQSGFLIDPYGLNLTLADAPINKLSEVGISIINNKSSSGNLNATFQLANPSGSDTFYLGGEEIPLGAALGVSSTPFTLVDDTSYPGTFGFSSQTFVATNLTAAISVVRSNGVFGVVSMRYSTTNITASAGSDYVGLTNLSMVFNQSQTTNGFNVTIKNNGYITNVEKTVGLRLFNLGTTPGATFGFSNAVLRIINPNYQGYVTLGATNYTGAVSAGALNFVVNRVSGSYGTISVQYGTSDGTATNGIDYLGGTNTLTWNSGDVSPRVVSIPLPNPGVVGTGTNKQFYATLFNPTLNTTSAPALFGLITNATLVITNDNNAGKLQFAASSYTVNEIGGYATISVIRTGGAISSISAQFATSDGTAFSGTNYVGTNGTVTLPAGVTSASFNVPILNDGVVDQSPSNIFFNVSLSGPWAGGQTNTIVQIVDAQQYNRPPGTPDTLFTTNGMNGDVLALGLLSSSQFFAGGNFTAVGPTPESRLARLNTDGSLDTTFLNGLSGANAAINALAIQAADGRILIGGAFTTFDGIQRNFIGRLMTDGTVDTSFNPASGADNTINAIAETFIGGVRRVYVGGAFGSIANTISAGLARLKADPSDNNNDGAVDGSFNVGSGIDGQVYAIAVYPANSIYAGKVLVGGSFAHYNGITVTNLVRLNVDGSFDTNFNANLGYGPNGVVRALAIQLGGQVLVGGAFTNFNGTPINRVCRLNTDGTLDTNFVAAVGSGASDTVTAIALQPDNRIVLVGNFAFVNGLTRNHITRLLPTGAPDPTINFGGGANGNVDAVVIQPDGNILIGGAFTEYDGQPHPGIARIYGGSETGSGSFSFSTGNFVAYENAVYAPIQIVRSGGTSGTNADGSGIISVHFATIGGGSAVPGTNYTPASADVAFPAGEVQETVFLPIMDDGVITTNLTVNLSLTNPTPPSALGIQPTATLHIVEVDTAIAFSQAFYTVAKNVPTGFTVIDVLRLGGDSTTNSVTFYTDTNGTAVVGTDYYPTNTTITFLPGQSDIQVWVPIINNNLVEGNRTINLVLTNAVGTGLISPSNAVLTILDTVSAPGQLFFSADNFTATAAQGYAYLPVLRTNGSSGSVSVSYTLIPGSAQPGVNYVNSPGTLTFAPGVTSQSVPVQLVNSGVIQGPVNLTVALSNPTGGATLTGPTNTTLTIFNTNAVFAFTQATNTVPEDAGVLNVGVARYDNTNVACSVQFATTNGTAIAGVNYSNTTGTLNFGVGESFKSISIPVINQSNIVNQTFGINLFSPVNGFVIPPSNTVVVLEGSAAGLSYSTNAVTISKNSGRLTFAVVCSNPRVEPLLLTSNTVPLEVSYFTVDGTARAGINYNPAFGTLLFTNGIGTNTFTVPILNNTLVSSNLTFSVQLTNVTAPGRITPYGTEVVTIKESNAGVRFSQSAYDVYKNGVYATINVYRTGFTDSVATVNYSVTNGTAIAGQNFYPTNGTLTFTNGITSQSFNVPLIANSLVQPNLYALLQLSNPTNAFIVNPGIATLTILETGGSFVEPAGSQVVTNYTSHRNDGIIGSNDTVQVLFAFRDAAGLNVSNLIAYLLATNGVTSPTPASQQYGQLTVYGHSASMPFKFTANGTNMLTISPTFQLYDGGKYIGPATFTYTIGSWTTNFANTNLIVIYDGAAASLYPSIINVSGVGGSLVKATVTITNLSHQNMSDVDALLVSPTTNTLIMGHAGGGFPATHVTLTFDDDATNSLPRNGTIVTSTNKPTQYYPVPNFP